MDGLLPDCETDNGCKIPKVHPLVSRTLEIRSRLAALSGLNIGPKILDIYNATIDDLEMLALAEEELSPKTENNNGDGSDMAAECEG